jgi:hypothetical protein
MTSHAPARQVGRRWRRVIDQADLVTPPRLRRPHAVPSCSVSRRGLSFLALGALLLVGCATGPRAHFADDPKFALDELTGDPAIDAVLTKLDAVTTGPATAMYSVLTKYGNVTHPATVVLSPGKRSITIDNTHYIQTEDVAVTCTLEPATCVNGFDPQRISDTLVTYEFYAKDAATGLRRKAAAKIGPATPSTQTLASQNATCVDVPLTGGTAVYCALDSGLLAKLDDGAVLVTLKAFGAAADPNTFVPPVAPTA